MIRQSGLVMIALVAMLLAACGGSTPAAAPKSNTAASVAPTTAPVPAAATGGMQNGATMIPVPTAMGAMPGMNHGAAVMGNEPFDALFIDSMIKHHQGAINMANQALKAAQKPEIKTLAQDIIKAQEAEIKQMQDWRTAWYPNLAPTQGMGMDMGTMMIADDASKPFDLRFIEAMIPHHQGAISMAKAAQQKAEHMEVKQLAAGIITAQEGEIAQMQQWKKTWFGQ